MVAISIALLSGGWLGSTGLTLLVALVPLLLISSEAEDSRKGWWSTFAYALLTFVGWNVATVWWVAYASPIGPISATIVSSFYSMLSFMVYHTVSKRAPKALAYTILVSLWIVCEKFYMESEVSWPWLFLGNGLSNDIWAVQWYEFTGIFGGTLWILVSNILLFEAIQDVERRRLRMVQFALKVSMPLLVSAIMFWSYGADDEPYERSLEVAILQPNIDFYDRATNTRKVVEENILSLLADVPSTADLVLLPETVVPAGYWESVVARAPFIEQMRDTLRAYSIGAKVIFGVNTMMPYYKGDELPYTARRSPISKDTYYDLFNSAAMISAAEADVDDVEIRHKSCLVIGVEQTPRWVLQLFDFLGVDMGNIAIGQLGVGGEGEAFDVKSERVGAAICYEGLYGEFMGDFVADGAEMMTIISNDCWWRQSPGYRHLYTISSLRAVEYRRSIARCANTGRSGFIDERGVSSQIMEWGERGIIVQRVGLSDRMTLYARLGDYLARIAQLVAALSLLYYVSYRVRKRHYLVD